MTRPIGSAPRRLLELGVRLLVATGLGIQAVVHLKLAPDYQLGYSDGIGGGNLFRIEAVMAIVASVYLLARGSRPAYLFSAVVALGGLTAVVLYRYVDIGSFGPVPGMYEPVWFFEKNLSAIAEGAAGMLALLGAVLVSSVDQLRGGRLLVLSGPPRMQSSPGPRHLP